MLDTATLLPKAIVYGGLAVLVHIVLREYRRRPPVTSPESGSFELRHSPLITIVGVAALAVAALLAAAHAYHVLTGRSSGLGVLVLVPVGAMAMGVYLIVSGGTRIRCDDGGLVTIRPLRGPIELTWDAIESVHYRSFGAVFVVDGAGRRIWIEQHLRGCDALLVELLTRLGPERVEPALASYAKDSTIVGSTTWEVTNGRPFAKGEVYRIESPAAPMERLRVAVGRVEFAPRLGYVVHVQLTNVPVARDIELSIVNNELITVVHLPLTEAALLESDLTPVDERCALEDFDSGYRTWKLDYLAHNAGAYQLPVTGVVETLRDAILSGAENEGAA